MKKLILLFEIISLSVLAKAQNFPACDSLVINCCTFDSIGTNTLTIYATNNSSVLFDYPGFVLFNPLMDTIAKETVNYFGIGGSAQPHTMNIVAPLVLPFSGYLNLYILFYDTLACSFPFTIPDTLTGIQVAANSKALKIYPNPAVNKISIEMKNFSTGDNLRLSVFNFLGEEIYRTPYDHSPLQLRLEETSAGIYFLRITDVENQLHGSGKIIVE